MKENFLHYLWQYQLFAKKKLQSTSGESIVVQKTGNHNSHSGPDFTNAKIQIGSQLWAGNVEIHLKASDWYVHAHEKDAAYDNVILHVVWEDDVAVFRNNNTTISTLELKGLVPKQIWNNYQVLFQKNNKWIACENRISTMETFQWKIWKERLFFERLEEKSLIVEKLLTNSVNDWEAVLFKLLAKNFGLKVNGEAFFIMANNIDFKVIRKERNSVIRLEALFMGHCGLLEKSIDDSYYRKLQEIYKYQRKKYQLSNPTSSIKFFRLRPANFPTIRLSQLASLFVQHENLFQKLMTIKNIDSFYELLPTHTSEYWNTHFSFGKVSKKTVKKTTTSFIDLLLINTLIPLRFVYQKHIGKQDSEALLHLIYQIKPEKNTIINRFRDLELSVENAFDSQALLSLKDSYCQPQRCLECIVGMHVLRG